MLRKLMPLVLAVPLIVATGCEGFGAGINHAVTGAVADDVTQHKSGYDLGVMLGNLLIAAISAASGYATRHVQGDKKPAN